VRRTVRPPPATDPPRKSGRLAHVKSSDVADPARDRRPVAVQPEGSRVDAGVVCDHDREHDRQDDLHDGNGGHEHEDEPLGREQRPRDHDRQRHL
jgi:hypothetical protein